MNAATIALIAATLGADPIAELIDSRRAGEHQQRYLCDVAAKLQWDRASFEQAVLEARDEGLVVCERLDLVTALTDEGRAKVERSELRYETECWHMIALAG